MYEDDGTSQCRCTDENYSESYAECDSDLDEAQDAYKNAKQNSALSSKTKSSVNNIACGDISRKSVAVEVLKDADPDRMRKISMQNLKLSMTFPKASLCATLLVNNNFIPILFFSHLKFTRDKY